MDKLLANLSILILCYLIGVLPISLVTLYLCTGQDIRKYGDGSTTITNVWRVLGPEWGICILLGEVLKGYLLILTTTAYFPVTVSPYLCLYAALLGRLRPIIKSYAGGDVLPILIGGLYAQGFPTIKVIMALVVITIGVSRSIAKGRIVFGLLILAGSVIWLPAPTFFGGLLLGSTQLTGLRKQLDFIHHDFSFKF